MTNMHAACKRCHRLRPLKEAGYCERCRQELRAAERPKQRLSQLAEEASDALADLPVHETSAVLMAKPILETGTPLVVEAERPPPLPETLSHASRILKPAPDPQPAVSEGSEKVDTPTSTDGSPGTEPGAVGPE